MKARTAILSSLVMVILATSTAWGLEQVPPELNVQGVLRNTAGEVVTGQYDIKISLYATENTTTDLISETFTGYNVVGGVFDLYLDITNNVFKDTSQMWLGIQVKASADSTWDTEMPRVQVSSVGYAFQAEHAEVADELLGAATDVDCSSSPCIGQDEVNFNWALGVSPGGAAADLECSTAGCVGTTDIADDAITRAKIGSHAVGSSELGTSSVLNSKIKADAVTTDKIKNGEVKTEDLADGAVTAAKIANGAVGKNQLGVNYADSDSKGGPANDLECTGCVSGGASGDVGSATITAVNLANGAVGTDQLADDAVTSGKIDDGTITGNDIATATINGGKLAAGTITNRELGVNYALGVTKGGAAADLACASGPCVASGEVNFNYAGSATKGGDATKALDLQCSGCVAASEVSFNYAGSSSPGGAANDLSCTGCVDNTALGNGSVTKAKLGDSGCASGQMLKWNGSAWICASDSTNSYTGAWGITISGTQISATQGDLDGRYLVKTKNWPLSHGKVIQILSGDGTATLGEASADGSSHVDVRLSLGGSATAANEQLTVYDAHGGTVAHYFKADGTAYHKGSLTIGGNYYGNGSHLTAVNADKLDSHDSSEFVLTNCTGCVSGQMIADGTVDTADLANGAVTNGKISNATIDKSKLNASSCSDGQILKLSGGTWACAADNNSGSYTGGWGITISGTTISAKKADLNTYYVYDDKPNSIKTGMIVDGTVANADIAANAIQTGNILDGQVTNADLANNSVTSAKIADGNVGTADLANNAVTSVKIADGQVATADLADNAVTNVKIADSTINRGKLNASGCSNGQILKLSSGSWACANYSAGISGSGSTNYLPIWTGSTSMGNSAISQDDTTVTLHSRDLVASGTIRTNTAFYVDGNKVIDDNGGWHRSYGNTGWYNGTYHGGWWMTDSSWVRSYNNKGVYTSGEMQAGTVRANTNLCIGSTCRTNWGHIDGDNLGNHTATTTLNMAGHSISNVPYIDVTSGNGHGLRFWSSNNYKISMGNASEYKYGGVTDYSIKTSMTNDTGRGWTWGITGSTPVAAINNVGRMDIKADMHAASFYGNGANVTNVNATKLQGHPASDFTTCNNNCMIHNQTSSNQSANFKISGTGYAGSFQTTSGNAGMGSNNELWADWINYQKHGTLNVGNGSGGYGAVKAQVWYDGGSGGCKLDPNGTSSLWLMNVYDLYVRQGIIANHAYVTDSLRVNNGMYVGSNGSNRGIWMGGNNYIAPFSNNTSYVGLWGQWGPDNMYRAFVRMYSYGFVTISDKNLKYDIRDVDDEDLTWALNSIRKAEIGFYWYKGEHKTPTAKEKKYHLATYRPYPHLGAMAQSLPEVVKEPGENVINLGDMIGLSYTAIRALDRNNQQLKAKVERLQGKVDYMTRILVSRGLITQDQLEEMNNLGIPKVNQ